MSERYAAIRDASFYMSLSHREPGLTDHVPRYHLIAANGSGPCCDPDRVLLDTEGTEMLAVEVPTDRRCKRPACASSWPTPRGEQSRSAEPDTREAVSADDLRDAIG
jgi:hypothetical protein